MPDWFSCEFWAKTWELWTKNNQAVYNLALLVGGVIGLWLLFIRTRAVDRTANAALEQAKTALDRHKEQTDADRMRRITESFAKAVEQLSSKRREIRLGGIYTLEHIAMESERDYWPIMETLTAYVRERAPRPPLQSDAADETADESETEAEPARQIRPATDIQAVLTVLGRRDETARRRDQTKGRRLDLMRTDLRGANLEEAHLEDAFLVRASMKGAILRDAHLEKASLAAANLEGAWLTRAHLQGADLWAANLKGVNLWETHLEGAHLFDAKNLTRGQLNTAFGDKWTRVRKDLRPTHWPEAYEEPPGAKE